MFESNDEYCFYKYVNFVIRAEGALRDITELDELNNIYMYMKNCLELNNLQENCKNNFFNELSYLREIKDENETERKMLINNMIVLMNNSVSDPNLEFYRYKLYESTNDVNYLNCYSNYEILNQVEYIDCMICLEYIIVCSHLMLQDEKIFDEIISLFDYDDYYRCIKSILCEYPNIKNEEQFINNFKKIFNKTEYKKISKENKKCIKLLMKQFKALK